MPPAVHFWMTEHPAWLPAAQGGRRVFMLPNGGRWLADITGGDLALTALNGEVTEPTADFFALPDGVAESVPELAVALSGLGQVGRLRNPSLWEALATGILRQVIRAAQSKKLYRAFSAAHGEVVTLPDGGTYALFPEPKAVLALDDEQFAELGLAFKRAPLRAAASAYLEHGDTWQELPHTALIDEIQSVPRIGPWTAGAAIADFTNDWALYPYGDLAVRTWANRAAPSHGWFLGDGAFGGQWRRLAGEHLSTLTLLTLAWGSHHGDIG
jgi:DNA-3-methyladenine glycosylase II